MSEISERYRRVAATFTERAEQVTAEGWEQPSPCEGWVARDVMQHMVDTSGFFLGRAGIEVGDGPSVRDDPVGAWVHARDAVQGALDDPAIARLEFDSPMGRQSLESMVGLFGVGDVLIHTWDLARATGLDDTLDPDEVHRLFEAMRPRDEMMRGTAFGPKVEPPPGADEQAQLIAFTGRQV